MLPFLNMYACPHFHCIHCSKWENKDKVLRIIMIIPTHQNNYNGKMCENQPNIVLFLAV